MAFTAGALAEALWKEITQYPCFCAVPLMINSDPSSCMTATAGATADCGYFTEVKVAAGPHSTKLDGAVQATNLPLGDRLGFPETPGRSRRFQDLPSVLAIT